MQADFITKPHDSHAYLVRLWRDGPNEPWRASAKQVVDGRELHFASLEKLFLFLHERTVTTSQLVMEAGPQTGL